MLHAFQTHFLHSSLNSGEGGAAEWEHVPRETELVALHSHNRLSPESGPGVLLDIIPMAAHLSSGSEIRDVLSGEGFSVAGGSAGH